MLISLALIVAFVLTEQVLPLLLLPLSWIFDLIFVFFIYAHLEQRRIIDEINEELN